MSDVVVIVLAVVWGALGFWAWRDAVRHTKNLSAVDYVMIPVHLVLGLLAMLSWLLISGRHPFHWPKQEEPTT